MVLSRDLGIRDDAMRRGGKLRPSDFCLLRLTRELTSINYVSNRTVRVIVGLNTEELPELPGHLKQGGNALCCGETCTVCTVSSLRKVLV